MQSSKEQFFNARKAVMKDIQHESSKIIGKCTGYSKITRAAWAIVAGKPEYAELLYGQKAGSDKSYQILMKLNADAIEALKILNWIRIFYYQDGDFQRVWPPYLRKEIDKEFDNSVKVANQSAQDDIDKRKFPLKFMLVFSVGFLFGFFLRGFLLRP